MKPSFLPLIDLSSKELIIKPGLSLNDELDPKTMLVKFGATIEEKGNTPQNSMHAHWCSKISNKLCSCKLNNSWPPRPILVRIECRNPQVSQMLEIAGMADHFKLNDLTNDIISSMIIQKKMHIRKRKLALVYPCLDTQWGFGAGKQFMVKDIAIGKISTMQKSQQTQKESELQKGEDTRQNGPSLRFTNNSTKRSSVTTHGPLLNQLMQSTAKEEQQNSVSLDHQNAPTRKTEQYFNSASSKRFSESSISGNFSESQDTQPNATDTIQEEEDSTEAQQETLDDKVAIPFAEDALDGGQESVSLPQSNLKIADAFKSEQDPDMKIHFGIEILPPVQVTRYKPISTGPQTKKTNKRPPKRHLSTIFPSQNQFSPFNLEFFKVALPKVSKKSPEMAISEEPSII